MRVRYVGTFVLLLAFGGCASNPATVKSHKGDSRWLLLKSPVTAEYPYGAVFAPLEGWPQVTEYASLDTCRASMGVTQDQLQLPLTCVATDDPRLQRRPRPASPD